MSAEEWRKLYIKLKGRLDILTTDQDFSSYPRAQIVFQQETGSERNFGG